MSNKIEIEGSTVEEAVQQALNALGTSRDKVEIDILHHPRKGILGIGARRAKVRASLREGVKIDGEEFEISSRGRDGRNNRRRGRGSDERGGGDKGDGRNRRGGGGAKSGESRDSKDSKDSKESKDQGPNRRGRGGRGGRSNDSQPSRDGQAGRSQDQAAASSSDNDRRQPQGEQNQPREGAGQGESTGRSRRRGGRGRGRDRDRRNSQEGTAETSSGEGRDANAPAAEGASQERESGGRGRGRGRRDRGSASTPAETTEVTTAQAGVAASGDSTSPARSEVGSSSAESKPVAEGRLGPVITVTPSNTGQSVDTPDESEVSAVPAEPVDLEALATRSGELTTELFNLMGFSAEVSTKVDQEEDEVVVGVRADAEGLLIGRRGQTLDALEHILNRMSLRADAAGDAHVLLDIGEYRQRRRESLAELAGRLRERALSEGRNVQVSPMSPRDRKFFQQALEADDSVETRSLGAGFYRRVVVVPSPAAVAAANANAEQTGEAESSDPPAVESQESTESTESRDPS
jgi:spoIIIJ-associated protein